MWTTEIEHGRRKDKDILRPWYNTKLTFIFFFFQEETQATYDQKKTVEILFIIWTFSLCKIF